MNNIKRGGRFSFRSNKRHSYSRTNHSFSNNKSRARTNIPLLFDKYTKLAKEASSSGDRIQAEYYHQFADHYSRLLNEKELKTFNSESENKDIKKESLESSNSENIENKENNESLNDKKINNNEYQDSEKSLNEEDHTLEKVSFISQPPKKIAKLKK